MYLDFADLASTIDNLASVVKAPGKGIDETIGEFKYDIENTLATSPVAVRRASVARATAKSIMGKGFSSTTIWC